MKKILSTLLVAFVLLFALFGSASADNLDRRVVIVNDTPLPILQVFGSNVGTTSWENDILGSNGIIPAYSTATLNFNDGTGYCKFDLKAVMLNGQYLIRTDVNVCVAEVWTITVR